MKSKQVDCGDVQIHLSYNRLSKSRTAEEAVLFVHGFPDNHHTWSYQLKALDKNYILGAIDLRGTGDSTAPADREGYNIENILPDLEMVIDELVGPRGKVHLVAHDWGALISWAFVSKERYQKRVKSYTAISCPHPAMAFSRTFEKIASMQPDQLWEVVSQTLKSWYIWFFQIPGLPELMIRTMPETLWKTTFKKGGLKESDEIFQTPRAEIVKATVNAVNLYRELVQNNRQKVPTQPIPVPVCLVVPQYDLAINPEVYNGHEKIVKDLEVHQYQANHWVHREMPAQINTLLDRFFQKHSG